MARHLFGSAWLRSLILAALVIASSRAIAIEAYDYAVQVSATVQTSPARITLSWPAGSDATGYTVTRRLVTDTTWGTGVSNGTNTTYVDSTVVAGTRYEYRVVKSGSSATGYGYIAVGIDMPLVESRGKVVLVVENTYAADLATELTRLQNDLVGDGWTVIRRDVNRNDSVPSVKAVIKAVYDSDTANVKAVFLFGRVPVPYSGNSAYDGHGDHQGAWPSDTFYADMNGAWTDTSVNNVTPSRGENDNIPGDGKYDQSSIPSDVELQVGRVDLFNMPAFLPKTEKDLLRQYLNKDHNFRHGLITAERRGLIDDNFGAFGGEAFASSGWRNFAPFFGASNVAWLDWFGTLPSNSYLWAYGCGGGWYQGAGGVGDTSQFAANDTKAIFTLLFGSYNGDWDVNDAFLRAPLATTTYGLTCAWAGRPHWFVHHMGIGETIGYSAKATQNNNYGGYQENNYGTRGSHVNLMGDPTLRMHVTLPPSGLTAVETSGVTLNWTAATETVAGYHVYRSPNATGPFTRISSNLVTGTTFNEASPPAGSLTYMVRAVKLESTPSGSYFNPSQGIFAAVTPPPATAPAAPSVLAASSNSALQVSLSWNDNSNNESQFKIERKTGSGGTYAQITTVGGDTTTYADTSVSSGTQYYYRIRASNVIGNSAYSNEANATTNSSVGDGNGTGLTGDYYDNMDFTALVLTRVDATVNFDYGNGSPHASVGVDTFSVRWRGQVQPKYSETFTFYTTTDDGVRLWVNNQQLVNNWIDQGATEKSGTIALVAGQKYDITMEYYENGGGASAKLAWSSPSQAKGIIPQSQFYPVGSPAMPGVPTGLTATAASSAQVDLAWTDNASDETSFKIERKTGVAGTFAQIGTAGANVKTYSDSSVAAGTTYYYQVRASSGAGNSAYSNTAAVTTPNSAPPQNTPPVVSAGSNQTVTFPTDAALIGTASDDGQPGPKLTTLWSVVSGPGTVTFGTAISLNSSASFSAPGTYVLRLTADDSALTASSDVTITVLPKADNTSPTLTSPASSSPTTVSVGQLATFSVGASDANGDALTVSWNYGDGTPATSASTHTFAVAGTYFVRATITDGQGGILTSDITMTVTDAATGGSGGGTGGPGGGGGGAVIPPGDNDLDGIPDDVDTDNDNDGVSNENEIADGTNPLNATSVNTMAFTVTKVRGSAKFNVSGRDSFTVSGFIPAMPATFTPNGLSAILDFGGVTQEFTLNAKGQARIAAGTFTLKMKMKRNKATKKLEFVGGNLPFSATLTKGSFVPAWADEGVDPSLSGKKRRVNFSVGMKLNGRLYGTQVATTYSAVAGKGGLFSATKKVRK